MTMTHDSGGSESDRVSKRRIAAGTVAIGIAAAAALRGLTRRFEIKEASMAPILEPGDWVLARKQSSAPERGNIVVFTDPTGSGMNLVKRVIGLPGEDIAIVDGQIGIDGSVLADPWANGITRPDGEWQIPADHVWVLGDNRGLSRSDGRLLGPIPIDSIGWQVVARYWPKNRIAPLT
jgi:signal peptidase I